MMLAMIILTKYSGLEEKLFYMIKLEIKCYIFLREILLHVV